MRVTWNRFIIMPVWMRENGLKPAPPKRVRTGSQCRQALRSKWILLLACMEDLGLFEQLPWDHWTQLLFAYAHDNALILSKYYCGYYIIVSCSILYS